MWKVVCAFRNCLKLKQERERRARVVNKRRTKRSRSLGKIKKHNSSLKSKPQIARIENGKAINESENKLTKSSTDNNLQMSEKSELLTQSFFSVDVDKEGEEKMTTQSENNGHTSSHGKHFLSRLNSRVSNIYMEDSLSRQQSRQSNTEQSKDTIFKSNQNLAKMFANLSITNFNLHEFKMICKRNDLLS